MQDRRRVPASRPIELPEPENFRVESGPTKTPGPGQVLIEVRYAALSPRQGQRLKDFTSFTQPFAIGEFIDCDILGKVVESNTAERGWRGRDGSASPVGHRPGSDQLARPGRCTR